MNTIEVSELNRLLLSGAAPQLIDVRTPAEFASGHIPGARNVPLDTLDHETIKQLSEQGKAIFICKGGTRGGKACEKAIASGLSALNLNGGTDAWRAAGLHVDGTHQAVMSLERQVRIVAGALVAAGTALGWFVNSAWLGVPLFVGCGLVFAGVTDTCAMGMLIAKLPWNQRVVCK